MISLSSGRGTPTVLWACVARNDDILVEAGEDTADGSVSATARELMKKDPTPGWEFHTQSRKSRLFGVGSVPPPQQQQHLDAHYGYEDPSGEELANQDISRSSHRNKWNWKLSNKSPLLKGAKFHVYDKDVNGDYIVWNFACVYNPQSIQKSTVQTFLTKLVSDTEHEREDDLRWLYGPPLACQECFAPMLRHHMMQVSSLEKFANFESHIEHAKLQMHRNIELILENDPKLSDLDVEATKLQEMASVFQKNAKRVHRMKMWQDAKHGVVLGTAITAVVAAVTVPPLIALL